MKLRKTIKKVVALTTGTFMLGATLLGAMATDLSQYPTPMFIKDGNFNGLIVIGEDANTQDMLGAMDIISSLQAVAVSGGTISGTSASTSIIGESFKIEKSSNVLNIGEDIESIKNNLDNTELPSILKDGTVKTNGGKEYDYEQEISFSNTNLELKQFSDKDYKDDEPTIGIPIEKNSLVFEYSLDFDTNLPIEKIEDREIQILGTKYDIVEASNTSLELMQGSLNTVLEEGETKIYTIDNKEYEVNVIGIFDENGQVKFKINDEVTDSMSVGDVYELNDGTSIGVREVLSNEAGDATADMVEFYLGAKKIILENDKELEVGDETIDNIDVKIDLGTVDSIDEITITWIADEDLFITSENDVIMPGLEAVKFYMTGFGSDTTEETTISGDGEDLKIETTLQDYDIELTILSDSENDKDFNILGEADDRQIITKTCGNVFNVTDDIEYFIVSYGNGDDSESHVLELSDIDEDNGVSVRDYNNDQVADNVEINDNFEVGDMTIDVIDYNETQNWAAFEIKNGLCDNKILYTSGGLAISLPAKANNKTSYTFTIIEPDKDENVESGESFSVIADFDDDNDVKINFDSDSKLSGDGFEEDTNGNNVGYINSEIGSKIIEDDDNNYIEISNPSEETNGDVYIGSLTSSVTVVEGDEDIVIPAAKIEVGAAVLDTTLSSYTNQNLIVIGGPAINRASASLLGKTYPSYGADSGIPENTGIIKLIEQTNGNVALIVAGWEAGDTQRASRVLAEYTEYDLDDKEVVITGTSMTDISVTMPEIITTEETTEETTEDTETNITE